MHRTQRRSRAIWTFVMVILFFTCLACSKTEQPQPEPKPAPPALSEQPANPQKEAAPAPVAPAPVKAPESAKPPAAMAPAPAAAPSPAPTAAPSSAPAATPSPAPAPAAIPPSSPAQEASSAPPPAPVHAAVGSEKCKMCHRVQYDSWTTSKHAAANPLVTCETCHGNGADYASMSVMKDGLKARAAGLVMPGKEFCTAKCHKTAAFTDDMLQKAHAHKVK